MRALLGILSCFLPQSADAQAYLTLEAHSEANGVRVVLRVDGDSSTRTDLVGFDIYRHAWGERDARGNCSDARVPISAEPLARTFSPEPYEFEILDTGLETDAMYYYMALPVDAQRAPTTEAWEAFDIRSSRASVSLGRALIGEVRVQGTAEPTAEPCPTSCYRWQWIVIVPSHRHIVGDQRFYQLYGYLRTGIADVEDALVVQDAVPMSCQVAVHTSPWGRVKALFRSP